MMPSEQHILTAFSQNPEEGAKLLFQRYYKPLMAFTGSFIADQYTCEDIVQNLFYQFIRKQIYRRTAPETLSSFLFCSARNSCLNHLRDRKTFTDIEQMELQALEEEAVTFSPELVAAIRQAIEELPEKTRQVITSIIIQRKKYKETAQEMNISVNTVKSQLRDGLKQLRQQFPASLLFFFLFKSGCSFPCSFQRHSLTRT
ncbi:MAG: sigma-70 family RNA polymerase sigma factor [Odoribacter sp.]|nr:sigma-70 family RNA polymerase sigma factor [Odoribacter sp.]